MKYTQNTRIPQDTQKTREPQESLETLESYRTQDSGPKTGPQNGPQNGPPNSGRTETPHSGPPNSGRTGWDPKTVPWVGVESYKPTDPDPRILQNTQDPQDSTGILTGI